ncbi:hypothetical protein DPMN_012349 [Dreissena polymorpha]|uniref:Uncharacterized protein n=1 Tax=Dreissena polymorpha TaxID=45954 RepID=A0A9D4S3A3_DREPO|nr:hypothetical protein DPMN_012349 [Dreissena polymorpha]
MKWGAEDYEERIIITRDGTLSNLNKKIWIAQVLQTAAFYLMVKLSSGYVSHKSEGDTRTVKRSGSGGEQA